MIVAISFMMFLLLSRGKTKKLLAFLVFVAFLVLIAYSYFNPSLFNRYFNNIVSGGNITDESNVYRFSSMKLYLSYIFDAPFGIGYNLTGTLRTSKGIESASAFSELVEVFLETGILGIATYIYAIAWMVFHLWKNKDNYSASLIATIIGIMILQIGTDYSPDVAYMIVIGLSIVQVSSFDSRMTKRTLQRSFDQPFVVN